MMNKNSVRDCRFFAFLQTGGVRSVMLGGSRSHVDMSVLLADGVPLFHGVICRL
jgi:hypothetical protein